MYDYVIVGAGPTGLTLALYLAKMNKKCALLEADENIGGCHRVTRDEEDCFSEHGPRIYSSAYKNVNTVLHDLGITWQDTFTPYNFNVADIQGKTWKNLKFRELLILFHNLLFGWKNSRNISMDAFMHKHHFTSESQDYIDRICRLTDGAGSDRYTLYQFLQLFNQNFFNTLYQPRIPHDRHLFKIWEDKLHALGVDIFKSWKVDYIDSNLNVVDTAGKSIQGNKVLMCVPPVAFYSIAQKQDRWIENILNRNLPFSLQDFVILNSYNTYLSITFHFFEKKDLTKIWGFPKNDWGIAFIILSDYMNVEEKYKLVISTCVTRMDAISSFTGKTAEQSSEDELKIEVFRQLQSVFANLKFFDKAILYKKFDSAYVRTFYNQSIPSKITDSLFYIGTHNENSDYAFTSMESAVISAMVCICEHLEPDCHIKIKSNTLTFLFVFITFLILILSTICFVLLKRK